MSFGETGSDNMLFLKKKKELLQWGEGEREEGRGKRGEKRGEGRGERGEGRGESGEERRGEERGEEKGNTLTVFVSAHTWGICLLHSSPYGTMRDNLRYDSKENKTEMNQ